MIHADDLFCQKSARMGGLGARRYACHEIAYTVNCDAYKHLFFTI